MKIYTLRDGIGVVELVSSMGDDLSIVNSARVSYNRESEIFLEKDERLIKYLLENRHTSPLEHVQFTFLVECPLFVARQWMRHRTWSFNEISRRYSSEDIRFYIPTRFRKQSLDNKQVSLDETLDDDLSKSLNTIVAMLNSDAIKTYETLLAKGVSREQARIVLPQSMYTKFYATVDLHNLLHFIDLRKHPHAQWEMQMYAQALEVFATSVVPNTMRIWYKLRGE